MGRIARGLGVVAGLVGVLLAAALALVASAPPPPAPAGDAFGFGGLAGVPAPELPPLRRHPAADGSELAYRLYPSEGPRLLVFVHGSSYHGGGYHALARELAARGAATVVTPNLRGHHLSGVRRGDVDYIGQLEDDLRDLIAALRRDGHAGEVVLGGHSSGGGLAIRFAGGEHASLVSRYLLLAPVVPTSPAVRGGDAGGWSRLHGRRLLGLLVLGAFGIHGFDALPIITFQKPSRYWDGTETLAYSYRLNASYHPRYDYEADLRALARSPTLVLVGSEDQALDPEALRALFPSAAAELELRVLDGVDHFGVFREPAALARIADWLPGH